MGSISHDGLDGPVCMLGGVVVLRKEGECISESRSEDNRVNAVYDLVNPEQLVVRLEIRPMGVVLTVPFANSTALVSIVDVGGLKLLISGTLVTFCGILRRKASKEKWGSVAVK